MSEASSSSTKSASGRTLSGDDLVAKLNRRANVPVGSAFSLTSHLSAGRVLVALRDAIMQGGELSKTSKLTLICIGIGLRRRHAASEVVVDAEGTSADAAVAKDQEDARILLLESAELVFTLLCMLERRTNGILEAKASAQVVKEIGSLALWDVIEPVSKKRPREEDETEELPWSEAIRVSTAEVAQHALRMGAAQLTEKTQEADGLMGLYFRMASSSFAEAMLLKSKSDFVSLGLNHGDMTVSREKKLLAIAQAAESEMGQSILRDLVLSFLLPASVIGVRRGMLLSRAASTEAGIDHPTAVSRAHDTAMAGAEFIWENGEDELERMCSILAGVAILTTKGGHDPIRTLEAFGGRVSLPFLETSGVGAVGMRMALIPNPKRWILYKINNNGTVKVLSSLTGFHGLCESVLALVVG